MVGSVSATVGEVVSVLSGGWLGEAPEPLVAAVVATLRVPRVALAGVVGAALATAGALVQGWFRNPLAEPGMLGLSGGASVAAAMALVLRPETPWLLPVAACGGAWAAVALAHRLATWSAAGGAAALLLAGVAVNATAAAGTGLLVTVADDRALRSLSFWTLGSLGGASREVLLWLAPALLGLVAAALTLRRPLDALLLGEATASHLGVDLRRLQAVVTLLVAGLVGLSVAVTGPIGFVGLVAPHLVRLVAGPRHDVLLPGAALAGAALVIGADALSRGIVAPLELPIGVVTTLIGGPSFLALLMRRPGGG
jgi:iron complex transport system permease protein